MRKNHEGCLVGGRVEPTPQFKTVCRWENNVAAIHGGCCRVELAVIFGCEMSGPLKQQDCAVCVSREPRGGERLYRH